MPDVFHLMQALQATRAQIADRDGDVWRDLERDVTVLIDRLTSLHDADLIPEAGVDRIHRQRIGAEAADDLVRRLRGLAEAPDDDERRQRVHVAVTSALRDLR